MSINPALSYLYRTHECNLVIMPFKREFLHLCQPSVSVCRWEDRKWPYDIFEWYWRKIRNYLIEDIFHSPRYVNKLLIIIVISNTWMQSSNYAFQAGIPLSLPTFPLTQQTRRIENGPYDIIEWYWWKTLFVEIILLKKFYHSHRWMQSSNYALQVGIPPSLPTVPLSLQMGG